MWKDSLIKDYVFGNLLMDQVAENCLVDMLLRDIKFTIAVVPGTIMSDGRSDPHKPFSKITDLFPCSSLTCLTCSITIKRHHNMCVGCRINYLADCYN